MLGIVLALALAAGEQAGEDAPGPSKGLLEYLVLFESVDGDWMDPELLPDDHNTQTSDETISNNKATDGPQVQPGRDDDAVHRGSDRTEPGAAGDDGPRARR